MTTLYIAGPMTGYPDLNFPAFEAAARELRAAGYTVISPAEVNPDHTMPWVTCMKRDIKALVDCDGVATLPHWKESRGATLEVSIATALSMAADPVGWWIARVAK